VDLLFKNCKYTIKKLWSEIKKGQEKTAERAIKKLASQQTSLNVMGGVNTVNTPSKPHHTHLH